MPRFEIFIDAGCSLCSHESKLLQRLDRGRGRLVVTDLQSLDFASGELGITYDDAMRQIYGRLPDGSLVRGVEVFRQAYRAVGWGWLWAPTGWPIIRQIVDALYERFAAWRYRKRMREGCGLPGNQAA